MQNDKILVTNNTEGFIRALHSRYAIIGVQKSMRRALRYLPKDDYCSVKTGFLMSYIRFNVFCF